ncbi:MAG: nitroreductase family protein [Clostridiales bacterium]|jgi:nitroreductase/NAD-dependent dihydropyrimidine dehydrogenase PreA subunit|nr:nitroreductase family protein [Clostridiales bacterium]
MVLIDHQKCIGCGRCEADCVAENIRLEGGKAVCEGPCILCGHCVSCCPAGAVSIPEYDMTEVETFDKDRFSLDIDRLLYTIKARRSIRQYAPKPVEREKLERIVQAGRYTATGGNRQGCHFIVVQEELSRFKEIIWNGIESTEKSAEAIQSALKRFVNMRERGIDFLFRDAPAVLFIAAESPVDAGLAAQNMELAAISQGLGALYNGYLVYAANMNPEAREWLDTKNKPISVCMLFGYPRVSYSRTAPRRTADVRWR